MFDPFTSLRAEWSFVGPMPTVDGERLAIDTTDGQQLVMSLPSLASASDRHAVGGRIIGAGTAQRFFALGFGSPPMFPPIGTSTAAYYCEHCAGGACGTTPFFSFTYTLDNSQFTHVQQTPTPPLAAGAFAFSADRAPPSIACTTSWPAGAQVGGSIPSAVTPSTFGIAVKSLAVSVDYFVLIRTE